MINHEALKTDVKVLNQKMSHDTITNKMLQSIAISIAEIAEMMRRDRERRTDEENTDTV